MINNERYITRGINEKLDIQVQIALWNFIDKLKGKQGFELDYLQAFKLRAISTRIIGKEQ